MSGGLIFFKHIIILTTHHKIYKIKTICGSKVMFLDFLIDKIKKKRLKCRVHSLSLIEII